MARPTASTIETGTVIIGASAAGLATAACLKQAGLPYFLLEQKSRIGARWRGHYDRLHLHTNRGLSGLPYRPMPSSYPRYPSRDQVVAYLEDYARALDLTPRFGQKVISVERAADGTWLTQTNDTAYRSKSVVIATGYTRQPYTPAFQGIDQFKGTILHSRDYKNGTPFKGQSVLVVGFGNSGGEIAVDLVEHGAKSALAVRGEVNIIPKEVFGIPVLAIGVYSSMTPPAVSDLLFAPLIRLLIGDIRKLGLKKQAYGPKMQIRRDKRIPLIDVGTIGQIRAGNIVVYPGIDHFTESKVVFEDGRELNADAVVMATGYRPALHDFLRGADTVIDEQGTPLVSGRESALPGLYFCGFFISPNGMLREIGIEARQIAQALSGKG